MTDDAEKEREITLTSPDYEPGTIRHIVLFRYREDIDGKDLQKSSESSTSSKHPSGMDAPTS